MVFGYDRLKTGMKYFTVVLICISLMSSDVEHLFMLIGYLYIFFGEMSIQILCPFKKLDFLKKIN